MILSGVIGEIASVDFHWYLDVEHGADYFRRWHAFAAHSGSLFVHKATHHFDLLNWYLAAEPEEVFARGELRHYGRSGPFRGPRCKICEHVDICDFHIDIGRDPWLDMLYEEPSREDGYFRDECVFREEIDIPDTMTAAILYDNGVQVAYSLNTFMPIEGHHLAFNGTRGRIEIRHTSGRRGRRRTRTRFWYAKFRPAERIIVPHGRAGISAATRRCKECCSSLAFLIRSGNGRDRAPARCRCSAAWRRWRARAREAPVKVKPMLEAAAGKEHVVSK